MGVWIGERALRRPCSPVVNRDGVVELEVLEVREESNEVQDLSTRALRFFEGKESKCRREVSEVPLDAWHKAGYLEIVYSKLLEGS
jgi:hypothetical protein